MVWTRKRPTSKRLLFYKQSKLYKQSKKEFYEGRNLLTSSSSFSQLFVNHKLDSQSSHKDIKFYGLSFGSKTRDCRKRLGKPNFIDSRSLVIKGIKLISTDFKSKVWNASYKFTSTKTSSFLDKWKLEKGMLK